MSYSIDIHISSCICTWILILNECFCYREGIYFSLMSLASNGPLLAVIFWGASMVDSGALTVGSLASFCWYAGILSGSVVEATEGVSGIMKAQGAGSRLFSLLERESSTVWGNVIPSEPVKGAISFRNVQVSG